MMELYIPLNGFYDLRKFKLTKVEFNKFWNIQKYLHHAEKNKEQLKKFNPTLWEKCKQLSADYQQELMKFESEEQ